MSTHSNTSSRVVIISGGSRGLGQALVTGCLERGYTVATFSRSQSPFLQTLTQRDPERQRLLWEPVDATDPAALRAFVGRVASTYGRVDALINNAGVGIDGILSTMQPAQIEQGIALNLKASIYLIQACAKHMLRQASGALINISSVNAVRGHSGVAVYSATKAALDGLTRSLARELGPKHIRVNSVAPGYIHTEMTQNLVDDPDFNGWVIGRTPAARWGTSADLVGPTIWLASAASDYVNGQTIFVDGGMTAVV